MSASLSVGQKDQPSCQSGPADSLRSAKKKNHQWFVGIFDQIYLNKANAVIAWSKCFFDFLL